MCHAVVTGGAVVTVRVCRDGSAAEVVFYAGGGSTRAGAAQPTTASEHALSVVGRVQWALGASGEVLAVTAVEEDATASVLPVVLTISRAARGSTTWVLQVCVCVCVCVCACARARARVCVCVCVCDV
jgi:hypothetical protein